MTTVVYLSGAITDNPDFVQEFADAADIVKKHTPNAVVLNPAMLPHGLTYAQYMSIRMPMVACSTHIFMVNEKWCDSRGARAERAYAKSLGLEL